MQSPNKDGKGKTVEKGKLANENSNQLPREDAKDQKVGDQKKTEAPKKDAQISEAAKAGQTEGRGTGFWKTVTNGTVIVTAFLARAKDSN